MRRQLLKIFALPAKATDADILAAADQCANLAAVHAAQSEEKQVIADMVRESCGGLSEKTARKVLKNRQIYALEAAQRP